MDYLRLCQAVASDVGIAGTDKADLPTAVAGNFGELRRVCRWVNDAWLEVQGRQRFDWMREQVELVVPAATNFVVGSENVPAVRYVKDHAYVDGATYGTREWLDWLDWDEFTLEYDVQFLTQQRRPTAYAIRPKDGALFINARPEANLKVYVTRYANPKNLIADGDTPGMPEDLHMLIVELAKVRYANFDEAGASRATAQAEVTRLKADLYARCLPELRLGGTLLD